MKRWRKTRRRISTSSIVSSIRGGARSRRKRGYEARTAPMVISGALFGSPKGRFVLHLHRQRRFRQGALTVLQFALGRDGRRYEGTARTNPLAEPLDHFLARKHRPDRWDPDHRRGRAHALDDGVGLRQLPQPYVRHVQLL